MGKRVMVMAVQERRKGSGDLKKGTLGRGGTTTGCLDATDQTDKKVGKEANEENCIFC